MPNRVAVLDEASEQADHDVQVRKPVSRTRKEGSRET